MSRTNMASAATNTYVLSPAKTSSAAANTNVLSPANTASAAANTNVQSLGPKKRIELYQKKFPIVKVPALYASSIAPSGAVTFYFLV